DELVSYAASRGVSSIIIGRTRERPIARMVGRTITQQLLTKGDRFELTIVNTPIARMRSRRREARGPWMTRVKEYGFATLVVAGALLLAALLDVFLPVASLALVLICAVVIVGVRSR